MSTVVVVDRHFAGLEDKIAADGVVELAELARAPAYVRSALGRLSASMQALMFAPGDGELSESTVRRLLSNAPDKVKALLVDAVAAVGIAAAAYNALSDEERDKRHSFALDATIAAAVYDYETACRDAEATSEQISTPFDLVPIIDGMVKLVTAMMSMVSSIDETRRQHLVLIVRRSKTGAMPDFLAQERETAAGRGAATLGRLAWRTQQGLRAITTSSIVAAWIKTNLFFELLNKYEMQFLQTNKLSVWRHVPSTFSIVKKLAAGNATIQWYGGIVPVVSLEAEYLPTLVANEVTRNATLGTAALISRKIAITTPVEQGVNFFTMFPSYITLPLLLIAALYYEANKYRREQERARADESAKRALRDRDERIDQLLRLAEARGDLLPPPPSDIYVPIPVAPPHPPQYTAPPPPAEHYVPPQKNASSCIGERLFAEASVVE